MHKRQGFTLFEIAAVLIVIGLVSGGILVGRELIRSSQLRSVMTDVQRYSTAVSAFQQRHDCLPGDCMNATDFFGQDLGNCANGTVASGTCNGDGDGQIGKFGCGQAACQVEVYYNGRERFLAWQHLALEGLIDGTFSGTSDPRTTNYFNRASVVGWNIPASRIANAGYLIGYINIVQSWDRWDFEGHGIFFGDPKTDPATTDEMWIGSLFEPTGPAISAVDAMELDNKNDDGRPNTGNVMSAYNHNSTKWVDGVELPTCAEMDAGTPRYTKNTGLDCSMLFRADF